MNKRPLLALAAIIVLLPLPALAEDLKFELVNNSSYVVTNFYTSPATTDNWEEDVLGTDILDAGQSVEITIADGSDQCVYDMKFSAKGADDLVVPGIDLCKLDGNQYVLTDK